MKKLLLVIAGSAILLSGCKPKTSTPKNNNTTTQKPVACFSINKDLLDSSETLVTTNCSTNAASYNWNFGLGITSSSTLTAPTYTYFKGTTPKRGTSYPVTLIAYNTDGSVQTQKDTSIRIGFRKIDSIVLVKVPGHILNDSTVFIQLLNGGAASQSTVTSPQVTIHGLPYTFHMDNIVTPFPIVINHTKYNNDGGWKGRVYANNVDVLSFGLNQAAPIFFSRGLNVSPIKITDGGCEIDVYYSLVTSD